MRKTDLSDDQQLFVQDMEAAGFRILHPAIRVWYWFDSPSGVWREGCHHVSVKPSGWHSWFVETNRQEREPVEIQTVGELRNLMTEFGFNPPL